MRYVTCFGGLWKMNEKKYVEFLKDYSEGKTVYADDYGTPICDSVLNITDLDTEGAKHELESESKMNSDR